MSTSAARLRELVQAATPGPWIPLRDGEVVTVCTHDGSEVLPWHEGADQVSEDDARLIALAPELAVLLADFADRLALVAEIAHDLDGHDDGLYEDCDYPGCDLSHRLFARLDGLLPEGGE